MTDERMALIELIETQADSDFVRDMLAFAADRIMEMEVEARAGAAKGARSPPREVRRNGYRDRDCDTRAGVSEAAQGQLLPGLPRTATNGRGCSFVLRLSLSVFGVKTCIPQG